MESISMGMVVAACWIIPPATLAILLTFVIRSSHIAAPTANAIATGVAASSIVLVFFLVAGVLAHGPVAAEPILGWAWKVPAFAAYVAIFAWCAGWACATLYLAGREAMRGRWGGPRCPTAMTTSLAFVLLLGLTAFYVDHARSVATLITADPPVVAEDE